MSKHRELLKIVFGFFSTIILLILEYTIGDISIVGTNVKIAILLPITIAIYLFLSFNLYKKAFKAIKHKSFFTETTLTLIASLAAIFILEFVEGLAVVVFFMIGEAFEEYAVNKSRDSIKSIINLRPEKVILFNNSIEKNVEPFDVNVGDLILVKNGDRVPIDGIVFRGNSSLDTSSMTGESVPRKVHEGEEIISGVINIGSPLVIKTTKEFSDSMMSKMLDLVENASSNKAKTEKFITKFAKIYTPIVIFLAFIVAIFPPLFIECNNPDVWIHFIRSGASFLVISCPCALVLSVPMAYFISLGQASKEKVLIKGSNFLDKFRKINTIVFDKTGTLTEGNFVIDQIVPTKFSSKDKLLNLVQYGEFFSTHPIATAIIGNNKNNLDKNLLSEYKEISGQGVETNFQGKKLLVGNSKLLIENKIQFNEIRTPFTIIYCAYNGEYLGYITIRDSIKKDSLNAINLLYKSGVKETYMLTGDNYDIANYVAKEVNITHCKSNLLPLDKVNCLKEIIDNKKGNIVAYVGDGINDAPSLSLSDLGISMGFKGSDLTIESSDAVIMNDDLKSISKVMKLSKKNHYVAVENITFALFIKIFVMILSLIPNISISNYIMWFAIFADVGVTILCVINSLRLMLKKH